MMTPRAVLSRFALVPFVWWIGHTLLATSACAAVYYVSPDGDDANPGTGNSPWQTLRHAWSQLDAGDTLRLMDGVHTVTEETKLFTDGRADAWITIERAENADPVVQGSMVFEDRTKLWITSYIRIRNLTFTNNGHFPLLLRGSHIIVENCIFHTCGAFMWTDPGYDITIRNNDFWFDNPRGRTGIRLRARSAVIENNTFHWTADGYAYSAILTWGAASNIEIRYNTFVGVPGRQFGGECVWMGALYKRNGEYVGNGGDWESSNIVVHDNVMYNCPVKAFSFKHARDCSFYHNTYYNPTYTDLVGGIYGVLHNRDGSPTAFDPALFHDPKNITIKNNIFYSGYPGSSKPLLQVYPYCDEGLQCNNNVWYTGGAVSSYVYWMLSGLISFPEYITQSGQDTASIFSDPLLRDPQNGDLHLLSNSPAIDAGAAPPQSWPDFDGNARPVGSGYDIGCYESPASSNPPMQSHTFQGGVRLVTMPATPSDPGLSVSDVFGTNLIVAWDPARQRYVYLNAPPDDPLFTIAPGCGFWVFFSEETTVSFLGNALRGGMSFEKSVSPGWNIIGNPWRTDMPWTSLSGSPDGSIAGMGWIYDPETGYVIVNSTGGLNAATSVPAYQAFWILAGSDADKVIIDPSGGGQSAARSVDALPIRWLVPIVVSAGDKRDVCNGIGAADTDVLIDNPPLVPEGVDAFITPVANPNARMAYELRSATGTQRFMLTVATELPNTDVTVALPDVSQLPKDYRVTLRDLDTGKLRHMRTARAYTYNSGPAGGQRQFEVEVGPTAGGALTVSGATVVPSRGTGAEIRYNVSEAASVTTRIYNVAGRLVAELERGRSVARGAVATVWDGRSAMGTVTPNGAYVVEIVAAGQDGQRARAVRPFVVSR